MKIAISVPDALFQRGERAANVSALLTVEKADLEPVVGALDPAQRRGLDEGLGLVLAL